MITQTTASVLWEAFKAFIRGSIISFESSRRKINKARSLELNNQINLLDRENAQAPSSDLHKKNISPKI